VFCHAQIFPREGRRKSVSQGHFVIFFKAFLKGFIYSCYSATVSFVLVNRGKYLFYKLIKRGTLIILTKVCRAGS
jgi:hypothetical protein